MPFRFFKKKLKALNRPYSNVLLEMVEGSTVADVFQVVGLEPADVEAVFLNGLVKPMETPLQEGDRLAMVPPGTPGPYRVLLGIRKGVKTGSI